MYLNKRVPATKRIAKPLAMSGVPKLLEILIHFNPQANQNVSGLATSTSFVHRKSQTYVARRGSGSTLPASAEDHENSKNSKRLGDAKGSLPHHCQVVFVDLATSCALHSVVFFAGSNGHGSPKHHCNVYGHSHYRCVHYDWYILVLYIHL